MLLRASYIVRACRCRLPLRLFSYYQGSSKDYYTILGVKRNATQREIKSAYYSLSKKFHPDIAGADVSAKAKFVEISEAWNCLKDPNSRNAYDNTMSGGGGRYPGDGTNQFRNFYQNRTHTEFRGNPFHNRQFTEQEFQRVWEQFNKMRNERETYDARMQWKRQRAFEEFQRQRAERWKQFHDKYPEGPPGQFKWDFKWNSNNDNDPKSGLDLLRRILKVYIITFFIVTVLRVLFMPNDESIRNKIQKKEEVPNEREQIERMMGAVLGTHTPKYPNPSETPNISDEKSQFTYMDKVPGSASNASQNMYDIPQEVEFSVWKSPQN